MLSVVQAEGLTLDAEYLSARRRYEGERYFASRFDIRYWILDREFVPLVTRGDGTREYVVVELVQGRVAVFMVPTFCFPESALLYRRTYGQDVRVSTRFVFSFTEHQPCSAESRALIENVRHGQGFRQLSLPSEYGSQLPTGFKFNARKFREDRDRRLARLLSGEN
jgi:hypothetical protein